MFNADSMPFQAGSIATTTFCEKNTKAKTIVAVNIANKLCLTAARLRNKGESVVCPNHNGNCTANVSESDPIGDGGRWSEAVSKNISNDQNIDGNTGNSDSRNHADVSRSTKRKVNHFKKNLGTYESP